MGSGPGRECGPRDLGLRRISAISDGFFLGIGFRMLLAFMGPIRCSEFSNIFFGSGCSGVCGYGSHRCLLALFRGKQV